MKKVEDDCKQRNGSVDRNTGGGGTVSIWYRDPINI